MTTGLRSVSSRGAPQGAARTQRTRCSRHRCDGRRPGGARPVRGKGRDEIAARQTTLKGRSNRIGAHMQWCRSGEHGVHELLARLPHVQRTRT
jgi:hypothetical protein